jgi:O-antigen/teichoic acid export membrane protein
VLAIAQVILFGLQLGYSAITSRILAADEFGRFAVASSAVGLLAVVSVGLPAAVLAARRLEAAQVSWATGITAMLGVGSMVALLLGGGLWVTLWRSPEAGDVARILCLQGLLAAPAALQLALLRREGRAVADAVVQVSAASIGAIAGVAAVHRWPHDLALVVNPTVTVAVTLLISWTLRRRRYRPSGWQHLPGSGAVSFHGIGFLLLSSIPLWAISLSFADEAVGHYSRALVLTAVPGMALAAVFSRTLHPYYRHLPGQAERVRALGDIQVLTTGLALPLFVLVAMTSDELVRLWLGPGWERAAGWAQLLALGTGVYLGYSVLNNALESFGMFRLVRLSQAGMLAVTLAAALLATVTRNPDYVVGALIPAALVGVILSTAVLHRGKNLPPGHLSRLLTQLAWALALPAAASIAARAAAESIGRAGFDEELAYLLLTGVFWLAGSLLTAKHQPTAEVAHRRGIAFMGR